MSIEKKYAKLNDDGKTLQVGIGTDEEFYKSIGMELMDVELAYNGQYYPAGQAPEKPKTDILREELSEQQNILSSTDWYAIRYADSGVEIPADIKAKRQAARERIDEIRAELKELVLTDNSGSSEYVKGKAQEIEALATELRQ